MRLGRAKKKLLRTMVVLLALALILVALLPTFINLGLARGRIEEAAASGLKGEVDIRQLHLSWFGGQRLGDAIVTDARGRQVADLELSIGDSLFSLLLGGAATIRAELSGTVGASLDERGRLDLADLLRESDPNEPSALASMDLLQVDVRGVTLNVRDVKADRTLEIRDIAGTVQYQPGRPLSVDLKGPTHAGDLEGSATLAVTLDRFLDSRGRVALPGAAIDATFEIDSVPVPMVAARDVVQHLRVVAKSDRLADRLDLSLDGEVALHDQDPCTLAGAIAVERLYAPDGAFNLALEGITGQVTGTRVPTTLFQPFLADTDYDATRDLGPTVDVSADFSSGAAKSVTLAVQSMHATLDARAVIDPATRAVRGDRLVLEARVHPELAEALTSLRIDRRAPARVELSSFALPPHDPQRPSMLAHIAATGALTIESAEPIALSLPGRAEPLAGLGSLFAEFDAAPLAQGLRLRGTAAGDFGVLTISERLSYLFDDAGRLSLDRVLVEGTTAIDGLPGSTLLRLLPPDSEVAGALGAVLGDSARASVVSALSPDGLKLDVEFAMPALTITAAATRRPRELVLHGADATIEVSPDLAGRLLARPDGDIALGAPVRATVHLDEHRIPGTAWTDYDLGMTPLTASFSAGEMLVANAPGLAEPIRVRDLKAIVSATLEPATWVALGGLVILRDATDHYLARVAFDLELDGDDAMLRPKGGIDIQQVDIAPLEAVLGAPAGAVSRWLGAAGDVGVRLVPQDESVIVRVTPAFDRFAGSFTASIDERHIGLAGRSDRFTLGAGPMARQAAPAPAPDAAPAAIVIVRDVPLQLDLRALRLPRAMLAGEPVDPASVALDAEVTGGPIELRLRDQTTTLNDLRATVRGDDLSQPVVFAVLAAPVGAAPAEGQVRGIDVGGSISKLLDAEHRFSAGGAQLQIDAAVEHLPTELVDDMLRLNGYLVAAVGPSMKAQVAADGFSRESGTLDSRFDTDYGWLEAHVIGSGGAVETAPDRPVTARLDLSPSLRQKVLYGLGPFLADLHTAKSPLDFRVSNATVPLDGDVSRLSADLDLTIGEVEYDSGSATLGLFRIFNIARGPTVPGFIEPVRVRIRNGVVNYEKFNIRIDKFTLPFSGTIDLVNKQVDLRTEAPMTGLALAIEELALVADLQVPIVIGGKFGSIKSQIDPNFDIGRALLERGIGRPLDEIFRNLDPSRWPANRPPPVLDIGGVLDAILGQGKKSGTPSATPPPKPGG